MKKLKILVSAHACSPYEGSEPGMGWNFVSELGKHHELHIITEKNRWEAPIKAYMKENPELCQNLHFYFIEKVRNDKLRKIWPPSYYWFYKQWQKKAYNLALTLDKEDDFDIIHQLNMVGYREPGYLWKMNKPYVWGPVGGFQNSPWRFLPGLGLKGMTFFAARNIINLWQYHLKRPRKSATHKNGAVIATTPNDANLIWKLWHKKAEIISEVGQDGTISSLPCKRKPNEALKIIWSAQHTTNKNLPLLFKALKNIAISYELHILGIGEMTKKWKKKAKNLNIEKQCIWYGWLERQKALDIVKRGHVFCITSIKELTGSVTLEALSLGLPIICLNHLGFSHAVTDKSGLKIPVSTPAKTIKGIQQALEKLYNNESFRQELSQGAFERAADFSWDKKIEKLNNIYYTLLKAKDNI